MKKLVLAVAMMVAFACGTASVDAAETPTVTFDGSTTLKYNVDASDFSDVFKGMVPSESRTLDVILKNDSDKNVDFYMSTKVMKAFEDAKDANAGAYKVSLESQTDGQKTLIYGQENGTTIGANESGLYDLNGALNDDYMIASLQPNKTATISLTITLDGTTLRNAYQGLPGVLQFDFSAQYPDAKEVKTVYKTTYIDKVIEKVKTGDTTQIGILIAAFAVAGGVIIVCVKKRRQKA